MIIRVTQEHIDAAIILKNVGLRSMHCPIGLAITGHSIKHIGACSTNFVPFRGNTYYFNDPIVRKFIDNFDHGHNVEPFEFEIDY